MSILYFLPLALTLLSPAPSEAFSPTLHLLRVHFDKHNIQLQRIDDVISTMKSSDVSLSSSLSSSSESDVALYPSSPQPLRRPKDTQAATTTTINLNPFEEKVMALESSINTLTWFTGNVREAEQVLRPRIQDILRSNPWLLGSLHGSSPMRLEYDANINAPTESDVDRVFQFFLHDESTSDEDKLKYGMTQEDNMRIARKNGHILEQSKCLVNTNKALFKVSLIPEIENRFALVGE